MKSGVYYGLAAGLCFASMTFTLKHFALEAGPTESALVRGLLGVVFLFPAFYRSRKVYFQKKGMKIWLRSFLGAGGVLCLFSSLQYGSASDAVMLSSLSPIFIILFSLILGQKMQIQEIIGALIVVGGVILLGSPQGAHIDPRVLMFGLSGAMFAGMAYLTLKRVTRDFSASEIVWAFNLCLCLVSVGMGGGSALHDRGSQYIFSGVGISVFVGMIVASFFGNAAQIFMTRTYARVSALSASILTLSVVLWSVLIESLYTGSLPPTGALVAYTVMLMGLVVVRVGKFNSLNKQIFR